MREILFRGKRVDNGEWVVGLVVKDFECYGQKDEHTYIVTHEHPSSCFGSDIYIEVIPETVGQYTGLTDKNGTKIFEGDILHFKAYRDGGFVCPVGTDIYHKVLFGHCNTDMIDLTEYVGFWALDEDYDENDLYEYGESISYLVNSHGAYVIGNIHDNPELLGGGEDA